MSNVLLHIENWSKGHFSNDPRELLVILVLHYISSIRLRQFFDVCQGVFGYLLRHDYSYFTLLEPHFDLKQYRLLRSTQQATFHKILLSQ